MKQTFGVLIVLSILFGVLNPLELPIWGRVLPPMILLTLQSLLLGKGMEKALELRGELSPPDDNPSGMTGICKWTVFKDGSWRMRAELDALPQNVAFDEAQQEQFAIAKGDELFKVRWVRSELSTSQSYGFRASLEGKSRAPEVGQSVSILRRGEPLLSGVLVTDC